MKNQITAAILFSFKGKNFSPSLQLDLNHFMTEGGKMPNLHPLIARTNDIDLYSYEYEMMQAESIIFTAAEGLAADFLIDTTLDIAAFESAWHEHKILKQLQEITSDTLSIPDLSQHPELRSALLQSYHLGIKSK
ncbi:hypothetical protein MNBD_GAMMA25-571 [hydrothermal vent metagenome]|uniref:Uncharacterized protein n=1 Tax=hydrothermal vent metagenome TaxID=652676 RepID=A0A3B1B1F9_9ZZZZ